MLKRVNAGVKQDEWLGEQVLRQPLLLQVLESRGVDCIRFAKSTLLEVCTSFELEFSRLVADLECLLNKPQQLDWQQAPLVDIISYTQERYHRPLRAGLPVLFERLQSLQIKRSIECPKLSELCLKVDRLTSDLLRHTDKEDRILFPWIVALERGEFYAGEISAPISVLEAEHHDADAVMAGIVELAKEGLLSHDPSFRFIVEDISIFKADLKRHMALENEILFPRAMRLA